MCATRSRYTIGSQREIKRPGLGKIASIIRRPCIGLALFRFESPCDLRLLFLLPLLFLMTFLRGRSEFFRHVFTPLMSGGQIVGPVAKDATRWPQ